MDLRPAYGSAVFWSYAPLSCLLGCPRPSLDKLFNRLYRRGFLSSGFARLAAYLTTQVLPVSRKFSFLLCIAACFMGPVAFAQELAGEWTLTIDTPRGVQHPTLVVSKEGEAYTGVYNSLRGPLNIESVDFDGTNFSFPLVITVPIGDIEVNYRGAIQGDKMTGTVQNPRGEVPFTAERTK